MQTPGMPTPTTPTMQMPGMLAPGMQTPGMQTPPTRPRRGNHLPLIDPLRPDRPARPTEPLGDHAMNGVPSSSSSSSHSGATPVDWKDQRIKVAICTYRRPELLDRLLHALVDLYDKAQPTSLGVVVVDDSPEREGGPIVQAVLGESTLPIEYVGLGSQNIAQSPQHGVGSGVGRLGLGLVFLDDDCAPHPRLARSALRRAARPRRRHRHLRGPLRRAAERADVAEGGQLHRGLQPVRRR